MGDLVLAENIETDNAPWPESRELVLIPQELELKTYSSEEDDEDTKSTISITDVRELTKHNGGTNVDQMNLTNCSVQVGDQSYYHGDVTIQQYVLNTQDAVKILPGQNGVNGKLAFLEGGFLPAITASDTEENKNLKSVLASLKCRHWWYASVILLFLIGLIVALVMFLPVQKEGGWDSEVSENSSLRLYTREEWEAQPARGEVEALKENPPPYVIIAHTAGSNCSSYATCSQKVRDTQMDHMGRGWSDMGMHFLVGGDGAAYTGLGWGKYGSHTIPFNRRSIAIYFIGNFMFVLPPKRQIRAAKLLIEEGVKLGKIAPNYKLFAHKQVWATESPGAALIEDIKKWPHWSTYEIEDD